MIDCTVVGSCVVDVLVRPMPLDASITRNQLFPVEPLRMETGGIVSNSGATLARLGLNVAALSLVGDDEFGAFVRSRYESLGIDASGLGVHPTAPTSTTAVLIDSNGDRSFAHCQGAPKQIDPAWIEEHLDWFVRSRSVILGYFSLMPLLEPDLPNVLQTMRDAGCLVALETAGTGGTLESLAPSLAMVDVYIPSYDEARHQTGETDERKMLGAFRTAGAAGVVGVKLGERGAVISPAAGEIIAIDAVEPPGPVVDTTGAGDAFLAGYVAGMLRGLSPAESGRLAAAAGACCVSALGASAGLRDFPQTAGMAGITLN